MTETEIIVLMQIEASDEGVLKSVAIATESAAIVNLIASKLVETIAEKLFLTEKGGVLVAMLLETPMPVEMKVERWVDPRT